MKAIISGLIVLLTILWFSPLLRSDPDAQADGSLLSPIELQQQINTVLVRYRMDLITEDGNVGPRTAHAYMEAYSLQEAERGQRGCYE